MESTERISDEKLKKLVRMSEKYIHMLKLGEEQMKKENAPVEKISEIQGHILRLTIELNRIKALFDMRSKLKLFKTFRHGKN